MFSTPAYWQGKVNKRLRNMIYTVAVNDQPKMFVMANGMINPAVESVARNFTFGYPGASPVISANNTTGGIMWAVNTSSFKTAGTAVLYAFDATNLENELYDSNQNSGDQPGPAVKFTVPTVANGSVYMGTQTQLAVFGMFPSRLTFNPASLAFGDKVSVGTTSKPKTVTITNSGRKRQHAGEYRDGKRIAAAIRDNVAMRKNPRASQELQSIGDLHAKRYDATTGNPDDCRRRAQLAADRNSVRNRIGRQNEVERREAAQSNLTTAQASAMQAAPPNSSSEPPNTAPWVARPRRYLAALFAMLMSATIFEGYDITIFHLATPEIAATFHLADPAIGLMATIVRFGRVLSFLV